MTPAERKTWVHTIGIALAVASVLASIHWGWISLPQIPVNVKTLGELPPASLKELAQLMVSIVVSIVFFAASWWLGSHLELRELRSLIESKNSSGGCDVLQIDDWNHTMLLSMLKQATPKHPVRIWTTFFVNDSEEIKVIEALARDGVRFEILVMRPDNIPLVRSRFRLRVNFTDNPPHKAQRRINDLIEDLKRIPGVEVKTCDTMPFGMFYQIGDHLMLVGLLLPKSSWENGPLMRWYPESRQWKIFEENWRVCWDQPLDQVHTTSPPPSAAAAAL
jgi:hypothetical protein